MPAEVTPQEERVARAICESQGLYPDHVLFPDADGAEDRALWRSFIRQAQAAIAAIPEPDPEKRSLGRRIVSAAKSAFM